MKASGAVSSTSRVRASERSSSWARSLKRRSSERDQEAGEQRRADGEQPAHDRAVGILDRQHDRVRDGHDRHVGERLDRPEEVERVQRRPHVEQRVERATGPRSSSRGSRSAMPESEHRVDVPVADVLARSPRPPRPPRSPPMRAARARGRSPRPSAGTTSVSSPRSAPAAEQVGDRASLDADVEELRERPHRSKPRKRCRRLAPRGARAPRGIRPRAA